MSKVSIPLKSNLSDQALRQLSNVYWSEGIWKVGDPKTNVWLVIDNVTREDRKKIHSMFTKSNNIGSTIFALRERGRNIPSLVNLVKRPTPSEMRWGKVNAGKELTYSINFSNNTLPFSNDELTAEIEYALSSMEGVCSVRFRKLGGSADIDIMFQSYDGPGSVLGLVYLPSRGKEISACNCGNVIIDNAENFNLMDFSHVFFHEHAHSLGLPHHTDGPSIMNPFFRFGQTRRPTLDPWMINELQKRYPY